MEEIETNYQNSLFAAFLVGQQTVRDILADETPRNFYDWYKEGGHSFENSNIKEKITQLREREQRLVEEKREIIKGCLKVRDALIKGDYEDAWHYLYETADKDFIKEEPWKDWEQLLKEPPVYDGWISVEDRLPEPDPVQIKAFSYFIKATNERYYSGYATKEYGKTTFFQHNGRRILRVTHWRPIN